MPRFMGQFSTQRNLCPPFFFGCLEKAGFMMDVIVVVEDYCTVIVVI